MKDSRGAHAVAAGALTFVCLALANGRAVGEGMSKAKCPQAEVRSISLTIKAGQEVLPDRPPGIYVAGPELPPAQQPPKSGTMTLIALGPVLASMDSKQINFESACGPDGVVLTATILRSAEYQGAALKFALWRPEVAIKLFFLREGLSLSTIWKMRLTDGTVVTHADTPPLATVHYPLTVTRYFHRP